MQKKTVGEFCNYVANHYKIDLNLEPIESEDEGELLVDFNTKHTDNEIQDIFKQLNLKGEINSCSAYERLLILYIILTMVPREAQQYFVFSDTAQREQTVTVHDQHAHESR